MKDISLFNSEVITMSSREIAELTGKRHPDVKRDIEVMLSQLQEDVSKFARIYLDSMNRQQTEYLLDRDHVDCLLTGYSAQARMIVIKRWRTLEEAVNPKLPDFTNASEAARAWADKNDALIESEKQKAIMAPKAEVFDRIVERTNLLNATQIGQPIGMSAIKVNQHLTELNVYNRSIKRGKAFQQWFVDGGYGEMTQTEMGYPQALFTTAGQAWVVQKFISEGVI